MHLNFASGPARLVANIEIGGPGGLGRLWSARVLCGSRMMMPLDWRHSMQQ